KSAWFKALDKVGLFIAAWAVKPGQLSRWIDQRLSSRGLSADSTVCRFLAERLEGNLLAAAQEVDRLALLFPGARLTLAQVREAVADNARFDAFRLVELSLTGQAGAALRCIRGLRETDTAAAAVIWAVGREVEVAWQVATRRQPAAQSYRELQVWPSRQGPIEACIHRLGAARLEALIPRLSQLDRLSKGQAEGDFWIELERLCVALAQTPERRAA
ncbi:MAG: DNA polymerase III subunit delta, partial [Gammaproteobacteria bacterium]|nr:DNA polymerase III subunit delta [Gammaproteobacteria bacterium]